MPQKSQVKIVEPRTFFADSLGRPASTIEGWPIRPRRPREKEIPFNLTKIFGIGPAKKVRGSQFSNQIKNLERIGIDARFFGSRQKGLGRYVQKLVEGLEKNTKYKIQNTRYNFIIFLRRENWDEYQPQNPAFKKVLTDYKWYGFKEQIFMPFKIRQEKIDLMHFPHFNLPIFCPRPFVVTIHDLVLKKFPTRRGSTLGPILYWLKNLAYRLVIWSAIKRAGKVIAVSNYTKNDILRYFRIRPEKIKVIYEGVPLRAASEGAEGAAPSAPIRKPYLLYVGNAYPHKNLERLILAFKKLVEDEQMDLRLVLAGEIDFFYNRLKNYTKYKSVIFTGLVSDADLEILYQNASLYIFPSLGEGFGLPPLEAMAFGLPVVSSKAGSLPEILGQAALYFAPNDIDGMVQAIKRGLEDKDLRKELTAKGFERIKKYSWSKMAQETLEVYRSVI